MPSGNLGIVLSNTSNTQSDINGVPLTMEGGQTVSYYLQDDLGTTRVMADSTGTLCYDADFYSFGGERPPYTDSCPQHYKFTGKERDSDSLDYYPARYGSSQLGRFMSPDPVGDFVADPANPQTWNLYSYVTNNPLSMTDPTGMIGCSYVTSQGATHYGTVSGMNSILVVTNVVTGGGCSWAWFDLGQLEALGQGPHPPEIGVRVTNFGVSDTPIILQTPPQSPVCGTSGFGGGIGVAVGGNGDAGLGLAGATPSGFGGGGLFYDSSTGFSNGLFAEGAALAYAMTHVAAAPSQGVQPGVLGAFAGGGASVFVTNARSVQQLSGPFTTYSLNIGLGPVKFSVQYAYAGSTKVLSIGPPYAGVSIGVSATRTTTNTLTQQRGCK